MAPLKIREEVLALISLNENIQSILLTGGRLNTDEIEIVKHCAKELLHALSSSQQSPQLRERQLQRGL